MVTSVVERATSSMLIGPDWALNMEICDMLNRDPPQGKDLVKGLKRRIRSKRPKIQLLTLTLLGTIVQNCGDFIHRHVAEKGVPHEMVKIYKKKPDYQVKEKILTLIDTWQEAFGGPMSRYPQYFTAYQDLLHAGAVFPQRSERAPIITPSQSHTLSSYPQSMHNSEYNHEGAIAGSSTKGESTILSLSEIQKVRSSLEVLSEMLGAINPGNKEALRQEALVELVEQCRSCMPRVVHLVNSTADESLLCQGLTLHDELQCVLAKYESVLSGVSVLQLEKPKPEPATQDRVTLERPLADARDNSKQADGRYTSEESAVTQSSTSAPPAANGTPTPLKAEAKMDLISVDLLGGDDYSSATQNLALVPISAPQPASPVASDQNAWALVDLISMDSNPPNPSNGPTALLSGTEFQQHQQQQQQYLHAQQGALHQNGMTPNMASLHEQSVYQQVPGLSWGGQSVHLQQQQPPSALYQNGTPQMGSPLEQSGYQHVSGPSWGAQQQLLSPLQQNGMTPGMGSGLEQSGYPQVSNPSWGAQSVSLQQQPSSPVYGGQNGGSLPLPPWESQPTEIQPFGNSFSTAMIISKTGNPQSTRIQTLGLPTAGNDQQIVGMFVQPITGSQLMALNQSFQMPTIYTQQPMQGSQMMGMLSQMTSMNPQQMYGNQIAGYGYGGYGQQQYQDTQYLDQGMYALSMKDDAAMSLASSNPSQLSIASYMPPVKQQPKASDLLFGDLLEMANKPAKTPSSGTGTM